MFLFSLFFSLCRMRKVAVFVCLVVFISEFGPALSLRLHHAKQQNEMVSRNPEKRWVGAGKISIKSNWFLDYWDHWLYLLFVNALSKGPPVSFRGVGFSFSLSRNPADHRQRRLVLEHTRYFYPWFPLVFREASQPHLNSNQNNKILSFLLFSTNNKGCFCFSKNSPPLWIQSRQGDWYLL